MERDLNALITEAKQRLPMAAAADKLGVTLDKHGICPLGSEVRKCSAYKPDYGFGCFRTSCPLHSDQLEAEGISKDQIGLYRYKLGVDKKTAIAHFLVDAGVWRQDQADEFLAERPPGPSKPEPSPEPAPPEYGDEDAPPPGEPPPPTADTPTAEPEAAPPDKPAKKKKRAKKSGGADDDDPPDNIVQFQDDPGPDDNPWHALWLRLTLTDAHRSSLKRKRGFTDDAIDRRGYRSSTPSNAPHIEALRDTYKDGALIQAGILVSKNGVISPNPQLLGYGNTGRKNPDTGRAEFSDRQEHWPVLIPYRDFAGRVFMLRPHKGGIASKVFKVVADAVDATYHIYGEHNLARHDDCRTVILTEGEFKADAADQAGIPCLAVPGIQICRKESILSELKDIFRRNGVYHVVIIFDNEVKDDPDLDSYKEDWRKRYDVHIWREVMRRTVLELVESAAVADLPDDERQRGKADFDGILARYVARLGAEDGTRAAAEIFRASMGNTVAPRQLGLLEDPVANHIENSVARFSHRHNVAFAGTYERSVAREIALLADSMGGVGYNSPAILAAKIDFQELATAFRSIDDASYGREPVNKQSRAGLQKRLRKQREDLKEAKANGYPAWKQRNLRRSILASKELLEGIPKRLIGFRSTALYNVQQDDGRHYFLVRFENKTNRIDRTLPVPGSALSRPANFREWCHDNGLGTWEGNERDTQGLTLDWEAQTTCRKVVAVPAWGYHEPSRIWFTKDVAITAEGKRLYPDADGIFWADFGYMVTMGMHDTGKNWATRPPSLLPPDVARSPTEKELFDTLTRDLDLDLADSRGSLLAGIYLFYGIAPQFGRDNNDQQPSVHIWGLGSSGKSTLSKLGSHIWGFGQSKGVPLSTTIPGLMRSLGQFSYLPLTWEEFRRELEPNVRDILRNAFDHFNNVKGAVSSQNATQVFPSLTCPVLVGEHQLDDPATRSRFLNIHVSASRRAPDPGRARFNRRSEIAPHLSKLGLYVLENQTAVYDAFRAHYSSWEQQVASVKIPMERLRMVGGVAYSMFAAIATCLDAVAADNLERVLKDTITLISATSLDMQNDSPVDDFFNTLCAMPFSGELSDFHAESLIMTSRDGFALSKSGSINTRQLDNARQEARNLVLINAAPTYDAYCAYKRRVGRDVFLTERQLTQELATLDWVATWGDGRAKWKATMPAPTGAGTRRASVWAFDLDRMPPDLKADFMGAMGHGDG